MGLAAKSREKVALPRFNASSDLPVDSVSLTLQRLMLQRKFCTRTVFFHWNQIVKSAQPYDSSGIVICFRYILHKIPNIPDDSSH